jgi:hypothetical protein
LLRARRSDHSTLVRYGGRDIERRSKNQHLRDEL